MLRYDGSNFKLDKLDFDDLAGGVGFQDLTGTPNFGIEDLDDVANYDSNDGLKIAQLNSTELKLHATLLVKCRPSSNLECLF